VLWLLCHIESLGIGEYPSPSGDTPKRSTNYCEGAYFETPAGIAAEIRYRLERTGKDGEILLAYMEGYEVQDNEDEIYNRWETLSEAAKSALNYICGRWRKRLDYSHWLSRRKSPKTGLSKALA
jgi:hypothetical protein